MQMLRFSVRFLLKRKALSLAILLTLAAGIGANTAMFTVVYAVLLAPMPNPHPEELVSVSSDLNGRRDWASAGDFLDWKRETSTFVELCAWSESGFNLSDRDQPENIRADRVTTNFFATMGDKFYLGRDFRPEEGVAGRDHIVILTHKLWTLLGADSQIVGKQILMDNESYTVVGVLERGPRDRADALMMVPLVFKPEQLNHDYHWINVMGRLKPSISVQQAQADIRGISERIGRHYPTSSRGRTVTVSPLRNASIPGDRRFMLWLMLGTVVLILLIACVNVANLLLASGLSRQREVAIRVALGATRAAVFLQFLCESLLLAALGGLLGVGLGYLLVRGATAFMPPHLLPAQADLSLNLPVAGFAVVVTLVTGVLFGCAPAWYASRVDPGSGMKEGGVSVAGGQRRLRQALVVGELVLAVSLLSGASLLIHSFWNLSQVDLGIHTDHVLTFVLGAPDSRSKDPGRIVQYYRQILASIKTVPGVHDATVMSGLPLKVPGFSMPFRFTGGLDNPEVHQSASVQQVSPDYFKTFGIRSTQGRTFTDQDDESSVRVAVVSQRFVDLYLPGVDPLRQRILMQQFIPGVAKLGPAVEWQIVGVFHTVRSFGLREEDGAEIDIPFWQSPWDSTTVGVRTMQDPESVLKSVGAAVHRVDPEIALAEPRTMTQVREEVLSNDRFTMVLLVAFSGLALLLSMIGIYGVMNFFVAQRSHELAIRIALGASRSRTLLFVLGEGAVLTVSGLVGGLVLALLVSHTLHSLLFGIGTIDVLSMAAVVLLIACIVGVASYFPARKASQINPLDALKTT